MNIIERSLKRTISNGVCKTFVAALLCAGAAQAAFGSDAAARTVGSDGAALAAGLEAAALEVGSDAAARTVGSDGAALAADLEAAALEVGSDAAARTVDVGSGVEARGVESGTGGEASAFAPATPDSTMTVEFSELFRQTRNPGWKGSPQGMAVSGDCMVQLYDSNPGMTLFSLPSGEVLGEIGFGPTKTWHNNNANFSSIRYKDDDELPLLYASQENIAEHKAVVWRIVRDKCGAYTANVVQTIEFPSPLEMGLYYPNLVLDESGGWIWLTGFSRQSWKSSENGNGVQLLRFPLPSARRKSVSFGTESVSERYCYDFMVATQGAVSRDGKLYQLFGVPKYGVTRLVCTDLATGKADWESPLGGIVAEPEGIAFWHDRLLVADVNGVVYISSQSF